MSILNKIKNIFGKKIEPDNQNTLNLIINLEENLFKLYRLCDNKSSKLENNKKFIIIKRNQENHHELLKVYSEISNKNTNTNGDALQQPTTEKINQINIEIKNKISITRDQKIEKIELLNILLDYEDKITNMLNHINQDYKAQTNQTHELKEIIQTLIDSHISQIERLKNL